MPAEQRVFGTAEVNGRESRLVIGGKAPRDTSGRRSSTETGVVVERQQTNKTGSGKVTILDDAEAGDELRINLTGNRVFTGTVRKTEDSVGDRTRLTAFDALHDLKRTPISETFDAETADSALQTVADKAGVELDFRRSGEPITAPFGSTISTSFKDVPADAVVEKLTKLAGKVWYINVDNVLVVTEASLVGESRELDRLIEASAGKRSPAYQSVEVTGSTPVSRRGRGSRHLIASQPVIATAGSGEPVFRFVDDDINSQRQAQNVADTLFRRLQKQQRGGFVVVLARSDIRPFDRVVMPPRRGGEEYLVEAVKHTVDDKTGYLTRLELGGLIES
jgi:hypothetical protein